MFHITTPQQSLYRNQSEKSVLIKNKEIMYQTKVNEQHEFEIGTTTLAEADILSMPNGKYHVLKDGKSYNAQLQEIDYTKNKATVAINGQNYQVDITDEFGQLIKKMGLSMNNTSVIKNIKAPMPGLVLEIMTEVGQTIAKGDSLLILEAMKMENVLKSAGDGVIKSIEVTKGMAVNKNQVLIELM